MPRCYTLAALGLLTACLPPSMSKLYAPPEDLAYPIDPACEVRFPGEDKVEPPADVDCKEERRRGMTRRAQAGLFTNFGAEDEGIRLVILGDTGVRAEDPTQVGDGPLAVLQHARQVCGGTCDGVVFLGDNLYKHGVEVQEDSAFLGAFARAWAPVGPQFYVPGNHDWGTYPIIKPPKLSRAQRELRELRRLQKEGLDIRGDSHFWSTTVGGGRLVGLDTNYLVRGCRVKGDGTVKCAGDPKVEDPQRVRFETMIQGLTAPGTGPSVVVGHHPWLSHGEHGQAGDYYDYTLFKKTSQGPQDGRALRTLLDAIVAPNAAIYISGHDHNTQVGRVDDATLSVVVGAGGKVTGPGKHTAAGGERHLDSIELEHFCDLGYAYLDVRPSTMTLQVHTLPAPIAAEKDRERMQECVEAWDRRRPGEERAASPSCTTWTWTQTDGTVGTWSEAAPCPAVAVGG